MKSRMRVLGILFLVFLCVASCGKKEEAKKPDHVTLQLKWVHQAQFAGFYVAREKGYYAEENLSVSFLEGGSDVDIAQSVISGKADFGVMSPEDILIKRSQGIGLTAIAAIYRRSAVVYASRTGSGISRPSDFKGKKVAVSGQAGSVRDFEFQFRALMEMQGIPLTEMEILPYDPSYADFIKGTTDVTAAYLTGGVIRLKKEGLALNIVWPGDYGVRFYSDTLVATEKLIQEKPDLVARFLRATLKGWQEAVGNPDEAVAETMKYARVKDAALQTAMMDALAPLVHTGEDNIGWMKAGDWKEMYRVLEGQNLLAGPLDPASAFTMQFLDRVYGGSGR